MRDANIIDMDVDTRVNKAIYESMDIYLTKLKTGFIDIGLEDTFKMHLADIIGKELEQRTFYKDEHFIVKFEKNMPIKDIKDYVDVVIEYQRGDTQKLYLIELKFKKSSDSAPDLGVVKSYIDIYNLDYHHANTSHVCGCYFIFMTDLETYIKQSNKGTRNQLPMHDGAEIVANNSYTVLGKAAKKASAQYPSGFIFSNNYNIEYQNSKINNTDYWHFILKI